MKKAFILIAVLLCLFVMGPVAGADESTTTEQDISGNVFAVSGCTVTFDQGPFGPGENGIATVDCGIVQEGAIYQVNYFYRPPVLHVYDDFGEIDSDFVYALGGIYLMDESGLRLFKVVKTMPNNTR